MARYFPRLTFRKLVKQTLLTLCVLLLAGYALWQARLLVSGPVILITPLPIVQTDRVVTIAGQAQNITGITLNDRTIFTDTKGYFSETLVLENGYSVVTVTGTDRYGRTKQVEQLFVYTPQAL